MNIYVGNFSGDYSEEHLRKEFERFGEVQSVTIPRDSENNPRNFGFVEMIQNSDARAAIKSMHGVKVNGRPLVVRSAHLRARRLDIKKRLGEFFSVSRQQVEFYLHDKTERDLVQQNFWTLKSIYLKINKDARSNPEYQDICLIIDDIFENLRASRKNNNYVEQLLIPLYNEKMLQVELQRRLVEGKVMLPANVWEYYKSATIKPITDPEICRSLLTRLVSDLQWRYEIRKLERLYARLIRIRTGVVFILAVIAFLFPTTVFNLGNPQFEYIFTAVKSGWLGATFSMLMTLNTRLKQSERNVMALKVQHRIGFIITRVIIGIGAALILLYFLQAGLLSGSVFPELNNLETSLDVKNYALLVVWCFLAGFSEKFVPNLLTRAEEQSMGKKEKKLPVPGSEES